MAASESDSQNTFPEMLWTYDIASNSYGGAAVGDIDGDGKLEVVFGTYMGDEHLYVLNAEDGSLLWKFWGGPGPLDASVKLMDVNGDNELEVVFATSGAYESGAGVMHVLEGETGNLLWEYDPNRCTDSPPAIADINNDGKPEILYGTFQSSSDGGYVHVLHGENGKLFRKIGPFNGHIQSGPAVLDLDCDGQLDIVVAMFGGDNKVYAVNGSDFSSMWTFQTGDSMYHGCSFADIDNDGKPEVVIGSYDENVYALNGEDGSLKWSYHGDGAFYITSIADLDNDGHYEIIASGNTQLTVLTHTGAKLWDISTALAFRGASIADIDDNGELDVVVGDSNGIIRVLRGNTGANIWSFDAKADYGQATFEIDHGPIIADLDGDEKLDIFFVGGRGYSSDPMNNYGRAYALRAGNGGGKGWCMFRHDFSNSGCFDNCREYGWFKGCVMDASTGTPLANAVVYVDSQATFTDADGNFAFQLLSGNYTVHVKKEGYNDHQQNIMAIGGMNQRLTITLTLKSAADQSTTTDASTTSTTTSTPGFSGMALILLLASLGILTIRRKSTAIIPP
jgi:outer membrane protein assembly factor BamB